MTTGIIIFSRFDSSRLPGKALRQINGLPLLGHVIERCKKVASAQKIVVATTDRPEDGPIAEYSETRGVNIFKGSLENVLERAVKCAELYEFDSIVRVCGDRPFLDYGLIDRAIDIYNNSRFDLVTNALKKTFPAGLMTEVIRTSSLKNLLLHHKLAVEDTEHVTKFFYDHSEEFSIFNIEATHPEYKELNLAVDTPSDLKKADWIAKKLPSISLGQGEYLASVQLALQYEELLIKKTK